MGVLINNECKIKICKQAGDCSLEGGRKMKKCKLVQNIRNFKIFYFIFFTMICLSVLPVSAFAKVNDIVYLCGFSAFVLSNDSSLALFAGRVIARLRSKRM